MSAPETSVCVVPEHYRVEAGVVSQDREKVVAIWRESEFGAASPAYQGSRFDWFYRGAEHAAAQHREGQINFLVHAQTQQPVGFLGVGLRQWMLGDRPLTAAVLVDFVVHPKHRTALPALMLQRYARERAAQVAQVVYGLPDTKAVTVFKRLGGQFDCQLPRLARVLRSDVYLRRLLPPRLARPLALFTDTLDKWSMHLQLIGTLDRGAWTDGFDARFDDLWARVPKQKRCIGVRDQAFLKWRFGQQPEHRYRIFVVTRRSTDALLMYFVCELRADTLMVKDCVHAGSEAQVRRGLLMLSLAARDLGAVAVSIQVCGDAVLSKALKLAQFIERDRRPFFAAIAQELRECTTGAAWYITPADEDI